MKIDEYLALYEEYRKSVIEMAKTIDLTRARKSGNGEETLLTQYSDLIGETSVEKEYERKKRILTKATKRLKNAISRIKDPDKAQYLMLRCFYLMTNEDIAAAMSYSLRHIYRLSRKAKDTLFVYLAEEMPKAKKTNKCIYRKMYKGRVRKLRKYAYKKE